MAWNEPGPGRDPWTQGSGGGKRGGSLDPEQLFKRLKARFSSGGRSGGPAAGATGAIVMLAVSLWLLSGFYTVDAQERAVVLRFGAFRNVTEAGLHWRMPWPVERVEIVKFTGVRQFTDRATMLTKDENIVDVALSVQYRVASAKDYLLNVADPDTTLAAATKAAVREVIGRMEMDVVLTSGREAIADQTRQLLQERLNDYRTGLAVTEVNLQEAKPPDDVQAAFADAISAHDDQLRARNEAESYAKERVPKARGAVARALNEAQAYHDEVIAHAEGDAARFSALLEQYRKSPKVTRERLYLETMQDIYAGNSKILVDADRDGPVLNLSLDQLLKNAGRSEGVGGESGASAPAAPQSRGNPAKPGADSGNRSRDRGNH
jgi:membrane protease subunit HflK